LAALRSEGKDDAACKCIDNLMDAMDRFIPVPERLEDQPFLMWIEDVFSIKGRGTVATGRVERGRGKRGDSVDLVGHSSVFNPTAGTDANVRKTVVTSVEAFNETKEVATAGENVGLLLRGIEREAVERGQVLSAPGSIAPHTRFEAQV